MANVDLVDLIPILKAIRNIKRQYKQAIQTEYDDFSLYPVLTENFLDTCYNNGYAVGFRQAWKDYLGSEEVEVTLPREMRELVPATFSDSGDADYDTLTSIMSFCLSIRQELKDILDLETDLFKLYPPQVDALAQDNYVQGLQDGYIVGMQAAGSVVIPYPIVNCVNNVVTLSSSIPDAIMYWKMNPLDEWNVYLSGDPRLVIEDDTTIWVYSSLGTKTSDVYSKELTYNAFYVPTFAFRNNNIVIYSNYSYDSGVVTYYHLSNWTDPNMWIKYSVDSGAIPISQTTTISAYNKLGEQQSAVNESTFTPVEIVVTKPATPTLTFNSNNNVLTITTTTSGAQIYYRKVGTNDWLPYYGAIALIESGTYEAYCSLNGVNSDTSSSLACNVTNPGSGGGNPSSVAPPIIIPGNNSFTITCSTPGATIMWQDVNTNLPSYWGTYSGKVDITSTITIQAKSILNSEEAYSVPVTVYYYEIQGGGSASTVAPPVFTVSSSVVSLTTTTAGATIYYRKEGDSTWIEYTSPFTVPETDFYEARAVLNGESSEIVSYRCESGIPIPAVPVISNYGNTVTITCYTSGATILYKKSTEFEWSTYSSPIELSSTTTYQAKSTKNGYESNVVEQECTFITVSSCSITCVNNSVTITCPTSGATIMYKKSTDSTWSTYSSPITIHENTTYQAKGVMQGVESTTTSYYCEYVDDTYYDEYYYQYFTIEAIDNGTLSIKPRLSGPSPYYSINEGAWTQWPQLNNSNDWLNLSVSAQDKIRFKMNYDGGPSRGWNWTGSTIKFNAYGNLLSLVYGDDFANHNSVNQTGAFQELFGTSTSESNFSGPKIVSAYNLVFPQLFGTYAFYAMFEHCKELTTVPRKLYATQLTYLCYAFMFEDCTSLTSVPSTLLPATTLADSCYYGMFNSCTSLVNAPNLPATTLASSCYYLMFENCSSLNYVKCLATDISAQYCTYRWLASVSNSGTFVKASGTSWTRDVSGIPSGWTVQEV